MKAVRPPKNTNPFRGMFKALRNMDPPEESIRTARFVLKSGNFRQYRRRGN